MRPASPCSDMPLPTLGHSRYCSVAMTTGGPDTSDSFELEVNPANPLQYRHDGRWRDMTLVGVDVGVKTGEKVEHKNDAVRLLAPRADRCPKRRPGLHDDHPLHQRDRPGRSGVRDAQGAQPRRDEAGPFATATDVAERHDRHRSGRHLLRSQRPRADPRQGDRAHLPIPGSESSNEWVGIHPFEDLLQIENPACGWMQNCNCSPHAMMKQGGPPASLYADHPYLYNERDDRVRHQRSEMVSDLLDAARRRHRRNRPLRSPSRPKCGTPNSGRTDSRKHGPRPRPTPTRRATPAASISRSPTGTGGAIPIRPARWPTRRSRPRSGATKPSRPSPRPSLTDSALVEAVRKGAEQLKDKFGEVEVPFGRYYRVGRRGGDRTWPVGGGSFRDVRRWSPLAPCRSTPPPTASR